MPALTPAQLKFIEKSRTAVGRAADLALEAELVKLPILAGEWKHIATQLKDAIGNQERAFRDQTLAVPEQLDLNHPQEG
jgi:hypothetical protein